MNSIKPIKLDDIEVTGSVKNTPFASTSDLSNFPTNIDNLKKVDLSSTSINAINGDLKRYYELLIIYLQTPASFSTYSNEFKSLTEKISRYQLTTSDYILMRDSLIETINYVKEFADTQIYGANGLYEVLENSLTTFENRLNEAVDGINAAYNNLEDGEIGKVFPSESITVKYLSIELKSFVDYIKTNIGVYVDRTPGANVSVPNGIVSKPVVIKIV